MYLDVLPSVYLWLWVLLSVHPSVWPSIHHIFRLLYICWQTTGKQSHKICMLMYPNDLPSADIDVDGYCCHFMHSSNCPTIHGIDWVQVLRTNRLEEMVYILSCWCIQITCPQFIDAYWYYCPFIHPFTTFSGFCTFADKSRGRNRTKFACWCIQMIYPRPTSMSMDIVVISCIRPSVWPSMGLIEFGYCEQIAWMKWSTFWHADVSRWLTLSLSMLMGIIVHLFVNPAIWVWVWFGLGGWLLPSLGLRGISVAITDNTFWLHIWFYMGYKQITPTSGRAWMSNYITLVYVDIITYPCPNFAAGLANLLTKGGWEQGGLSFIILHLGAISRVFGPWG